jgi:hypothetical protein
MQGNQALLPLLEKSCSGEIAAFGKMFSTLVGILVVLSFGSGTRKRISALSSETSSIPATNLSAYNRCKKQHLSSMPW